MWFYKIMDMWFKPFQLGSGVDLTGFEHVICGEQKKGKVQGHHWWYKYYLDDNGGLLEDSIDYISPKYERGRTGYLTEQGMQVPDVVTLGYKWKAYDYEQDKYRPLFKPIGGFWVGCSIECLLALGAIRCDYRLATPKDTTINNVKYKLHLYRSPDKKSIRTFYPVFDGVN